MTKEIAAKETKKDEIGVLFPPNPESSRLLVGCRRVDYSASRIAHAVEDCDAQLINLNVTSRTTREVAEDGDCEAAPGDSWLVVDLRVTHRSPHAVVRSLERYGYEVLGMDGGTESGEEAARSRIDEFLRYLSV